MTRCKNPIPVQEEPDYFVTGSGKKEILLEPIEMKDERGGYPLRNLYYEDRGNNRGVSLQADFETPHELTFIAFPRV